MALPVSHFTTRAQDLLFDATSIRWPVPELIRWLNDAQREIVLQRPDAKIVTRDFTLTSDGVKHTLPTLDIRLIDVRRVVGGYALTQIDMAVLDSSIPDWPNQPTTTNPRHYMFDQRDPRTFFLFPPAKSGVKVEVVTSRAPAEAIESGNIDLDDIYAGPLLDWMMYRCYSKDATHAANMQRAQFHYKAFYDSLGVRARADYGAAPQVEFREQKR